VTRYAKYTELVTLSNTGAKEIARVPLAQLVRMTVDLPVVTASMLAKLAIHLNRTPSEIVADAVKKHLETGGEP
jgi:hypothetical protein